MMSKEEAKINREMLMLKKDQAPRIGVSMSQSEPRKFIIAGIRTNIPDLNAKPCSDSEEEEEGEITKAIQNLAGSVDPKLLFELEVEIFARLPCFEYWKLQFLNKQFFQLKSSEILRRIQEGGLVKPYVIMHSGGHSSWKMYDTDFANFRRLSEVPSLDYTFFCSDKETISVGTQLIVIGKETESIGVFRYELENHKWFKGPSMITPRIMYGSASHGANAFFAGGIHIDKNNIYVVVNKAEKYNAVTNMWTVIKGMHKRRKFSSGCFLGGKFYVLGGRDENDEYLTSGERYDEAKNSWELIPDMLKDITFASFGTPPLIAVVEDNLYSLETSSSEVRVYDINANVWMKLGVVPVNAAFGWGIAFKSMGDRLLVVGPSRYGRTVLYTCRPSPYVKEQIWEEFRHSCNGVPLPQFIQNCCVMFA